VGAVFMSSIYVILGIFSVIGLIKHFYFEKKIRCKSCSQKIDASSVKCKHCGTFIEKKVLKQNKIFKYMQKRVDGVHNDLLDQRRRD
jgi:Fe2+ or Zn2+ uptake regulation protein